MLLHNFMHSLHTVFQFDANILHSGDDTRRSLSSRFRYPLLAEFYYRVPMCVPIHTYYHLLHYLKYLNFCLVVYPIFDLTCSSTTY